MNIRLVIDENMSVVDALAQTLNSPYTICKKRNRISKKL